MLSLSNVTKSYDGQRVLSPTALEIEPGKTTVLIGPSGCGKSTLLRLMIGLISPDEGTVRFRDEELSARSLLEIRRHMGYVIQDGGLFPHLTARRNVTVMADYLRWERAKVTARVAELRDLTHLREEALDRYPAQISGGQRQRVSLMRALMLDPDVLLLDEPLGALDPMIRAELQYELSEIFRALHKTVVMVTHDMREAAFFSDVIVLMRGGKIVQKGTIHELMHEPADPFVTQFIRAHDQSWEGETA